MMFLVSRRSNVRDQFWKRGNVSPSGATAMTFPPLATVGSMNGGNLTFCCGNPASSKKAGENPFVRFGATGFEANPRFGSPAANWENATPA